jgi:hypothetical protein
MNTTSMNVTLRTSACVLFAAVACLVVATVMAPLSQASAVPTNAVLANAVVGVSSVGTTRHTAADRSWSVQVPNSWVSSEIGTRGQAKEFRHNNQNAFTFTIDANNAPLGSPARYLQDQLAMHRKADRVIVRQEIKTIQGMKVVRFAFFESDAPKHITAHIVVFRVGAPRASQVVYIKATVDKSAPNSASRTDELDAMMRSRVVK